MNKLIPIAAVIVLCAGAAVYVGTRGKAVTPGSPAPTAEAQRQAGKKSLKDLLGIGISQKCTYAAGSDMAGGTVYAMSGKVRGDLDMQQDGRAVPSHMIMDGNTIYIWSDGQPQGMKLTVDSQTGADTETNTQGIDADTAYEMTCVPQVVDAGMFTVPADVEFTDLSGFMPNVQVTAAAGASGAALGETTEEDNCAECDTLPGSAKIACRQALSCP